MRLDIRYTARICPSHLSDLSHPDVVLSPKASRLGLAASIELLYFFLVSSLRSASPCRAKHIAPVGPQPLCAMALFSLSDPSCTSGLGPKASRLHCWPCPSCWRLSSSYHLCSILTSRTEHIARVGPQLLYAMAFDCVDKADRSCSRLGIVLLQSIRHSCQCSLLTKTPPLGGRCRLGCWPRAFCRRCRRFKSWTAYLQGSLPALCSLRFGLVSSIFGDLMYVLSQYALVLPAIGVPFSSSSSVRDTDYLRETQNSDPGVRGGQRLLCAPRVLHLGCQYGCQSLRCHRRTHSADNRA
jgi:hypothetical protein